MMTARTAIWAAGLAISGLAAGAAALILAEFGAPVWVFIGLLGWLLTAALPTSVAVVLLAGLWPGPSFGAFVTAAAASAFVCQLVTIAAVRALLARGRGVGR